NIEEETDARARSLLGGLHTYSPPKDGNNLTLTIDTSIQYIVEQQLDELMTNSMPKSATVIVMEPKTGKVLAMGNRPSFDPNSYTKYPDAVWQNPAITSQYEPGSTFKIITASTAVEEGTTSANKLYKDPGYLDVDNHRITNWDSGKSVLGTVPLIKGMEQSSNVVLGQVGLELGRETFFKYIRGFGFGQPTGIDLPGEATGTLLKEQRTSKFEQATMSFGQANAATPLQMITAVSAVANGGTLFRPYVVEKITDPQGNLIRENKPVPVRQVISKYTSEQLKTMLESVVANGTGGNARIQGYRIAGKTGTAQKVEENGKYSEDHYIASFIGFAPADDPRIAVLVIVDSASKGAFRGGEIAAPRFKAIVEQTLQYLNVPRSGNSSEPPLEVTPTTRPTAKPVVPERKPGTGEGIVPDLTGRTMSEVGEMLSKQGLRMNFVGSGLAVSQDIPPGKVVSVGTVITVKFEP
ncbi:MAG TPA: penicillin-binding transpeptidase domain-containing protein, partial [Verrucomicrobiae bacterium]|nr:penicillin-binding transpeptidase domain-containing protein [Verrucomicrobiae bacterium]